MTVAVAHCALPLLKLNVASASQQVLKQDVIGLCSGASIEKA
ncbi:hypothetical protein [Paenibacillus azoreducens]|uniref:Uncharacterized protein n=1 Tax=Paenibacillus azoreducens TaxID=116718 RepID=A0A919YDR0_9BACL|nr:hypothetical protein [Paenibacillus azoreducens]GIO47798.1 hypothetical protein J34TS1_25630 [Paenibacillus azoreducens]